MSEAAASFIPNFLLFLFLLVLASWNPLLLTPNSLRINQSKDGNSTGITGPV